MYIIMILLGNYLHLMITISITITVFRRADLALKVTYLMVFVDENELFCSEKDQKKNKKLPILLHSCFLSHRS